MARKKTENVNQNFEEATGGYLDSNRALKLQIIEQIEKINNHYYLATILKYINSLK